MSVQTSPRPAPSGTSEPQPDGVHTYRGRRLEEIIPQIRNELGPDAVILRQREGLTGGVSGFFAQRCVEVDARAGTRLLDVYDDDDDYEEDRDAGGRDATTPPPAVDRRPSKPDPERGLLSTQRPVPASSFATELADAETSPPEELPAQHSPAKARLEEILAAAGWQDIEDIPAVTVSEETVITGRTPEAAAPAVPGATAKRRPPSTPLDADVVAAAVPDLTDRGISDTWAHRLIALGGAHSSPFAGGDLREAVLCTIAAGLPAPATLPLAGAAVAIVGAGGAGKTRTAAALASAYGRGSTLAVTVVSLGSGDGGREITELLCDEGDVHVVAAADAREATMTVSEGRAQGLVIIDTAAVRPGEPAGVAALAGELDGLDLDAVYIAVPATLSPRAATNLIDSFAAVAPTGIVITHADEIDHLGVAVEISHDTGIPVAYVHDGLELDRALSVVNPYTLAKRLLR